MFSPVLKIHGHVAASEAIRNTVSAVYERKNSFLMFYSTVGWAVRRPPSLRSIAKYTSHTRDTYSDRDAAMYADPALKRQWMERNVESPKTNSAKKKRSGPARRDETLPSSWFPANEFRHEYVSAARITEFIRIRIAWMVYKRDASRRTEARSGSFPERGARVLCRTLEIVAIEGKRETGRGVTEFSLRLPFFVLEAVL